MLNTLKSGVLRDTGLGHYLRCAAPTSLLSVVLGAAYTPPGMVVHTVVVGLHTHCYRQTFARPPVFFLVLTR